MKIPEIIPSKILTISELTQQLSRWRLMSKTIAFTNGCFDLLHPGHIASLSQAAKEADFLIVGLNSDSSTRGLKGPGRPILDQHSRATILAALIVVDAVVIFDDPTPLELIKIISPDVLIKGGDYRLDEIVGAKEVMASGGKVVINPIVEGYSSTAILKKIIAL
jgi:D-glycero-beta-D-manno-heptose 1-phosphate adenylyltransferase